MEEVKLFWMKQELTSFMACPQKFKYWRTVKCRQAL